MATTTVSAVTSGGVLTVASTTGFDITESVQLTGTAFGGLVANSTYWIIDLNATNKTITLSTSLYGSPIAVTGGSGSMTLSAYRQLGPGAGNTITANTAGDYNTIQGLAAKVMGAPVDATPTYGYNQSLLSSQVFPATPDKVTQSQWANLATDLIKARIHQTGDVNEGNNLPVPTTSNLVTETFRKSYYDFAQLVYTSANTFAANQMIPVNVGTAARANEWNGNIQSTATLDFGSSAGARAFFNAGGLITVACTLTGSFGAKSSSKDNTWAGMFGAMGTVTIGPNSTYTVGALGTTGYTSTPANIGFFQLTTSAQQLFQETPPSSGSYAANSFKVFGSLDGTGRYMYLQIQYNDASTVSGPNGTFGGGDEYIDGILTQYIGCRRASGSYVSLPPPGISFSGDLTNMSGNPSIYGLSSSAYYVTEGDTFTVTLQTQNVNDGTQLYYTVYGMNATPNGVSRWSATSPYFTVSNGGASIQFTIANDLYSDGQSTMAIQLNNGLASVNINVNDSSQTPTGYVFYSNSQIFGTNTGTISGGYFTVPTGIYSLHLYMVAGGGGGGNRAGGGGGGGQVVSTTVAVSPGQSIRVIPGGGGGAGGNGGTTYFGAYTALGGYGGSSGSGYSGATGGTSGQGYGGGGGSSTSAGAAFALAGGGGGGQGGGGSAASGSTSGSGGPGTLIQNVGNANDAFYWGGGGEGGSSYNTGGSASYGGGQGGGAAQNGSNGADGTGGGGGGGGVTVSGGTYTGKYVDGTISGNTGGSGGGGAIVIAWP